MRGIRYLIIAIVAIAMLAVVALVYLFTTDLGQFEDEIEDYISEEIGRSFHIEGEFSLRIGETVDLIAEEVYLANPDWGVAENLISIERLIASISLRSLFDGPLIVHNLEILGFEMNVEEDPETGASNLDFAMNEVESEIPEDVDVSSRPIPLVFENVEIENFAVVYGEGWLEESRRIVIERASVDGDPGELLNIAVTGNIDGMMPLQANGTVGPLEALISGENVRWDLALAVGQFEATTSGAFRDAINLTGPDVQLNVSGPSAEDFLGRFGLPVVAVGSIDMRATLIEDAEGVNANLNGAFGNLTTDVSLQVDSLQELQAGRLTMEVAGPDVRVVSAIADIGDLAAEPFSIKILAAVEDGIVDVSTLDFSVGDDLLNAKARIDGVQDIESIWVDMSLSGPDAEQILRPWVASGIPAAAYTVSGVFEFDGSSLSSDNLDVSIGDDQLHAKAKVDGVPDIENIWLDMSLGGPNAAQFLKPWVASGIPAVPYAVSGVFDFDGSSLSFEGADISIRDFSASLNGTTGRLPALDGMDISFVASNKDVPLVRQLLREHAPDFALPSKAMSLAGAVTRRGDQWALRNLSVVSGAHEIKVDGVLGNLSDITGVDVVVSAKGPDIREFRREAVVPEELPYNISGAVNVSDDLISFSDVVAKLGGMSAKLDGRLPISLRLSDADAALHLQIPDLDKLGKLTGNEWLRGGEFEFSGRLSQEGQRYVAENMSVRLGDSDARGDISIEVEPKLRISGVLQSDRMDLAPFLPELTAEDDGEEVEAKIAEKSDPLVIPDIALPLDFLGFADLEVDYKIGDFQTRRYRVANINLFLRMDEDNLQVRTGDVALAGGGEMSVELGAARNDTGADVGVRLVGTDFSLREHVDDEGKPLQRPLMDVDMELAGSGANLRELAASANGYARSQWGEGQIENAMTGIIMRDVLSQVLSVINPAAKKEKFMTLECAVVDVEVVDGFLTTNVVAGRTPSISVASVGTINLASEEIDLSFRTRQREGIGISLAGAVNPYFKIAGSLGEPALVIDAKRGFFAGTVAVLTAGVSILAQGVFDRYLAADNLCEAVLEGLDAGEIGDQTNKDELSLDNLLPFMKKSK